jgi:hypothetical protein
MEMAHTRLRVPKRPSRKLLDALKARFDSTWKMPGYPAFFRVFSYRHRRIVSRYRACLPASARIASSFPATETIWRGSGVPDRPR